MLGHISESIKIAIVGCQYSRNLNVKYFKSIGKNWWTVFLNLKFSNIFDELSVEVVIKTVLIVLFFSNS